MTPTTEEIKEFLKNEDHDLLIEVKVRIEELIKRLDRFEEYHKEKHIVYERRLTQLEQWKWKVVGASGIIAVVVTYLMQLL